METKPNGLDLLADVPVGVRPCSVAASLALVGERWALLAIRELSYGVHRFDQIVGYTGAPRDILTDRLRKLVDADLVERRQYSQRPPRSEYHLTQAGHELFPVLLALNAWGDRWAVGSPALTFRHDCGEVLDVVHSCRSCGREVVPQGLTPEVAAAT